MSVPDHENVGVPKRLDEFNYKLCLIGREVGDIDRNKVSLVDVVDDPGLKPGPLSLEELTVKASDSVVGKP